MSATREPGGASLEAAGESAPEAGSDLYQAALDEIVAELKPERGLIMRSENGSLRILAAAGFPLGDGGTLDLPVSLFLLRDVLESAEPARVDDLQKHARYLARHSVILSEVRSLVCVPLWLEGHQQSPSGLIYLDSRLAPSFFQARDQANLVRRARQLEERLRGPREAEPRPEKAPITVRLDRPQTPSLPGGERLLERLRGLLAGWRGDPEAPWKSWTSSWSARVTFLRSLATMLGAGIDVGRALDQLAQSQAEPRMARIVSLLTQRILFEGFTLSRAFRSCPRAFPDTVVAMLAVAEESGSLPQMLDAGATYMEKLHALRQRLQAALIYPAAVLALAAGMLVLGLPFLFRNQLALVHSLGGNLPAYTRLLVRLGLALTRWEVLAGLALAGVVTGALIFWRLSRPGVLPQLYARALSAPVLGRILRLAAARGFAQAYAVMNHSGLKVTVALPLAAASSGSPLMEAQTESVMRALVEEGKPLTQALRGFQELPASFFHMLAAAEESGALGPTLAGLERIYGWELEARLETALALLEPLIMLGLGLVVGLVMMATLLPMTQLLQAL